MSITRRTMILGAPALLAACGARQTIPTYSGPPVTSVMAFKSSRSLYLMSGSETLKAYKFQLGFNPQGPKRWEGDGRTPEGVYRIDRRNPNSAYHLSIGISYPNANDRALARAMGREPGGDIFIHGTPAQVAGRPDWTAGCIAVMNEEMDEIYAMVRDNTQIILAP
ncbi:L,D-transpeptidase family protein [Pseudoroseicyclus aestuarii]|uniref:L,D-transpeptidase-like protein n=1 Tax=Pseudoroseicyclus aestuarii TaxID=1795041 RepID=A0A318SVI8_9RHOB|nr:L,D-transpeptidase family protein [Pseudoroseicyclus aestuarii]PYE84346.1 L,D-transpeptidase-like protein [Pseudoroseicyclus aestuarii]